MKKFTYAILIAVVAWGCSPESTEISTLDGSSVNSRGKVQNSGNGGNQQEALNVPTLECGVVTDTTLEIIVTAGETGAAGGFDVHWTTEENFLLNNSEWVEDTYCEMGFSGNGNDLYSLASGESISLNLKDLIAESECGTIDCGVTYVFRVRAKTEGGQGQQGGLKKSDWSPNFSCATAGCVCTYGKGYWRNHSSVNPGNQEDMWPVETLFLGENEYTQEEMNAIFDVPNNEGNNLVILSQHLIAAKLNVANGVDDSSVVDDIIAADELIGTKVILEDSFDADQKEYVNSVKNELEAFNESRPCSDDEELAQE